MLSWKAHRHTLFVTCLVGITSLQAQLTQNREKSHPESIRIEGSNGSASERDLLEDFDIPQFSSFGFLITYFPSEFIRNGIELKSYVGSDRFRELRKQFGDLRAADAMYIRSLRLTEGNTAMALLFCTLAAMDHRVVGINVPVLKIFLPLSNESFEDFTQRVENIPSHFYADSPSNTVGDRDKLQHFFGSAFVANVFESRDAAERVGYFIEWGEDAFIVDGAYDERDLRANRQGREFGLALITSTNQQEHGKWLLPSDFLAVHLAGANEHQASSAVHLSCGVW